MLEGCGGNPNSPSGNSVPNLQTINASSANGVVTVTVDSASPLASVGSAALVQASIGNFLVARTAQDVFSAVTAICTHEGCTVTGYASQTYTCPCHGSQYDTAGQVIRGPATKSLQRYATSFASPTLTITT